MKTRILLVDDHELVREGLSLVLQNEPGVEIVGGAADAATGLAQARELRPDLILMDMDLGDIDGIETSRKILESVPETRIVVLSGAVDSDMLHKGIEAGIKGFLLKTNAAEELIRAVRVVANGSAYLCPQASQTLVTCFKDLLHRPPSSNKSLLTARERDVLKLTAEGLRMKDIANRLNIGVRTVETHRSQLMRKLACGSSAELTRHALREGISTI
jgi:DNA-binding NarL/FixJ family response regulator